MIKQAHIKAQDVRAAVFSDIVGAFESQNTVKGFFPSVNKQAQLTAHIDTAKKNWIMWSIEGRYMVIRVVIGNPELYARIKEQQAVIEKSVNGKVGFEDNAMCIKFGLPFNWSVWNAKSYADAMLRLGHAVLSLVKKDIEWNDLGQSLGSR
jgi:hypothetical protein